MNAKLTADAIYSYMETPNSYSSNDLHKILQLQLGRRNNGPLKPYEQKAYDILMGRIGPNHSEHAQKCFKMHGYIRTAFITLLHLTRKQQLTSNYEFNFLKDYDEILYHCMFLHRAHGGEGGICEPIAIAVRAHYLAEIKLNQRIDIPQVQRAIEAIQIAL